MTLRPATGFAPLLFLWAIIAAIPLGAQAHAKGEVPCRPQLVHAQ